ncbi:MAG: hypothetical protein ABFS08_09740 [Pseudomonadota bacterium]
MTGNKHLSLSLLLLLLLPLQVVADTSVWFLYDDANAHHRKYVEESEALLVKALPEVTVRRANLTGGVPLDASGGRTLLISVGSKAAQHAADSELPTLNTLVTRRTFNSLRGQYDSPVSAIYLDQPVARHLQLVKSALPSRNKMTVLLGRESQLLTKGLAQQSQRLGMQLQVITVDDESAINKLFGRELLAEDTLLLLPDPEVVNRRTVKPLVLGSYRQGIPLIGYSQALVKAGALMAVHSSLPALEKRLSEVVQYYFKSGVLSAPGHVDDFEISVNYQLARALKIFLPSEKNLKQTLQEQLR